MKNSVQKKLALQAKLNRERVSSFVVDLRQKEVVVKTEISRGEKKLFKDLKTKYQVVSGAIKQVKPNLLLLEKKAARSWRQYFRQLAGLGRFKISVNWPKKRGRLISPWQEFIQFQEKKFATALVGTVNRLSGKKGIKSVKRLVVAKLAPDSASSWYSPLFSFVAILVLIVIPFKLLAHFQIGSFSDWEAGIMAKSEAALGNMMAAAEAVAEQDFEGAETSFQVAGENFLAAQVELAKINDGLLILAGFSKDPKIKMASESKNIMAAGVSASSLGRNLVLATDSLFTDQETDFSRRLENFLVYGKEAIKDAKLLAVAVSKIKLTNIPEAQRARFAVLSNQAAKLAATLEEFVSAGEKIKSALGLTRDKRYLIVFQNNAELRASGGFLGSYALVDVREGGIRKLEVPAGGSYDLEAGRKVTVAAPEPLWLVDPLWRFWDANWWPDWPTTAQNLMWFYENSGGSSVDGVISVTPAVVESLLRVTGPIDMTEEYGLVVGADNFWQDVKVIVERDNLALTHPEVVADLPEKSLQPIETILPIEQGLEVNTRNKPKKIIGDLLVKIMEVLPQKLNQENLIDLLTLFEDNMAAKHILVYFKDPVLQSEASIRNWGGEVKASEGDYLMVVNTNIAGQKSDRVMSEEIQHSSTVSPDGTVINTLKIIRTHNGIKREAMTGVRNVDWLRVYVPAGSQLISADGFRRPDEQYLQDRPESGWQEIPLLQAERQAVIDLGTGTRTYEENGKQVFANWLMVDPGETAIVTLTYRLPKNFFEPLAVSDWKTRLNSWLNPSEKAVLPYSLLVQKQPGAAPSVFSSRLKLPVATEIIWRHPEDMNLQDGWEVKTNLDRDKYWSVLLKKNN